jgi:hypothetical protein
MNTQPNQDMRKLLHDLRNGLAVIRLTAQYIERATNCGVPPEKIHASAQKILSNVDQITARIDAAQTFPNPPEPDETQI